MASPEIHAKCGASNAYRYLACTASPTFEAQFPASTSIYAEEGTLAHSICELFVKTHSDADAMAEELRSLQQHKLYQPEMLTCAKIYCDWIMEKALGYTNPPAIMTEQQVDFSDVVPEGFGTCDCVMIGDDALNIFDYKHGKGVRCGCRGQSTDAALRPRCPCEVPPLVRRHHQKSAHDHHPASNQRRSV